MNFVVSLKVNNQTVPVQFFDTFEDATSFVSHNANPSFQIYQCTQDHNMLDDSYDYNLEPYGRGYILTTSEENPLYGEKYFNSDLVEDFEGSGFWNSKASGWFFRKDNLDALNDFLDNCVSEDEDETEDEDVSNGLVVGDGVSNEDLNSMYLEEYGKGYLLFPQENDTRIGTKSFLGGWWMPKHDAWFFKAEHYEHLEALGAQTMESNQDSDHPFDNTEYEKHGKGYLVYPNDDHPSYGEKYYHNGWWMPKHNAWFFKTDAFQTINA
jgi:hypothetical protein